VGYYSEAPVNATISPNQLNEARTGPSQAKENTVNTKASHRRVARTILTTAALFTGIALGAAPPASADHEDPRPADVARCMSFGDSLADCCYWANGTYIRTPNNPLGMCIYTHETNPNGRLGTSTPGATAILTPASNTRAGIQ
jgi:hypothetical protein